MSLGSLCNQIHVIFDILEESACCSACDVTMASVDPIALQALFAASQFSALEEIL